MADEPTNSTTTVTPTPSPVDTVQEPATPAVTPEPEEAEEPHPALNVSSSEPITKRDPYYGHGGTYTIDEDTGIRVPVIK